MTFFALKKTLGLLAMPAGLLWLALLAAALLCWRRGRRRPAALCLGIALAYACVGNLYLGSALAASLERRLAPVTVADLQPFDARQFVDALFGEGGN